jgi:hypothetical protein
MRLVNRWVLSKLVHPSGELMGPRAPLAPKAGREDDVADAGAAAPVRPAELDAVELPVLADEVPPALSEDDDIGW